MISALFIVQSYPKWFVHFWMTFCKNSIRISYQISLVNKPHSCASPFKLFLYYVSMKPKLNKKNIQERICLIIYLKCNNFFNVVVTFSKNDKCIRRSPWIPNGAIVWSDQYWQTKLFNAIWLANTRIGQYLHFGNILWSIILIAEH